MKVKDERSVLWRKTLKSTSKKVLTVFSQGLRTICGKNGLRRIEKNHTEAEIKKNRPKQYSTENTFLSRGINNSKTE